MKKTAIYIRCSTNEQKQDVDTQKLALEQWAAANGHEITRAYADYESGTRSSRQQFDQMLKDTHNAKRGWSTLAFYDLSRLTREGPLQTLQYLEGLKTRGIDFHSLQEPYLSSMGPFGDAIVAFIGTINKIYTDSLKLKIKDGLANARRKGVKLGAPVRINEQCILEMLATGASLKRTADECGCSISSVKNVKRKHAAAAVNRQ